MTDAQYNPESGKGKTKKSADVTPTEIRLRLYNNGFSPLPDCGKECFLPGWSKHDETNPAEIRLWAQLYPDWINSGILCKRAATLDADIIDPDAAEEVEQLIRDRFGEHGRILVRIGRAPKRAFPFKSDTPFKKIMVLLVAPNENYDEIVADQTKCKNKIEFLCDGQQLVVHGIHPDTHQPYRWHGGALDEVTRDELPAISPDDAQQLVDDIVGLLTVEHGYRRIGAKVRREPPTRTCHDDDDDIGPVYLSRVRDYMRFVPSWGDHDRRIQVGMAIHHTTNGSDEGYEIWTEWLGRSGRLDLRKANRCWRGFGRGEHDHPLTFRSIVHWAREADPDCEIKLFFEFRRRVACLTVPRQWSRFLPATFRNCPRTSPCCRPTSSALRPESA